MDKASRSCFVQSPEHCLIEKYIRVARLHRSMMERRLDGTGVYRSQHQILMFVSDNPNVSQKELARMYGVSGATIAVSLKKLERGGYIGRLVDQEDKKHPCSDEQLAKLLEAEGMAISRRTVAKYRMELGIGGAFSRREE